MGQKCKGFSLANSSLFLIKMLVVDGTSRSILKQLAVTCYCRSHSVDNAATQAFMMGIGEVIEYSTPLR